MKKVKRKSPKNKKDENKETQDEGSKEGSTDGKTADTYRHGRRKEDPWKEIDKIINTLHYQWNSYLPLQQKRMREEI